MFVNSVAIFGSCLRERTAQLFENFLGTPGSSLRFHQVFLSVHDLRRQVHTQRSALLNKRIPALLLMNAQNSQGLRIVHLVEFR